ncbi:MAG: carboxypeptidase-like regulatory domain-containing protein [Bryobacteraceae bacterium]
MPARVSVGLVCLATAVQALLAEPALAQGTIAGSVLGGSQIAIPNPRVRVKELATGAERVITAGYDGRFIVKGLAGGRYRVSVISFACFDEVTVELREGETARADLRARRLAMSAAHSKPKPVSMAELARRRSPGVSAVEVSDYVFGGYRGGFPAPPHADGNPRKAYIVFWKDFPYRFVFAHEGSYCPWFELPSGAGLSYQFFEGNQGWAELFNDWGRKERNSYVEILDAGPTRVWVRWTYFGVNMRNGEPAYRGTEDFWAFSNGLILRRQTYETLRPGDDRGHTREPVEMIGLCPVGKRWFDILARNPASSGESHALAVLDPFSTRRYDVFWKHKPQTVWEATARRSGARWQELDDSPGVALIVPMREGSPFCIFGDASGFRHDFTRIKEHSHPDTGGVGWISQSWDHWPIGWLNSQAHPVDSDSLQRYPNHFSPAGMDFFALPNEESEKGLFYSLIGVGPNQVERVRALAREWLTLGPAGIPKLENTGRLKAVYHGE